MGLYAFSAIGTLGMLLDPKGLFYSEKLARCSDLAKLHWPRLVAACNGFGRMELSYRKIVSTVYVNFEKPPSEQELGDMLVEYRENFLLFIYQAPNGSLWGQWEMAQKYLPKFKTAGDKQSPVPPPQELKIWRDEYIEAVKTKSVWYQSFQELRNLPESSKIGEGY